MRLFLICCLIVVTAANLWGATAAVSRWVPGVRIALEVRTPSGEMRTYHTPPRFTYWTPELPVIQGDSVTVDCFVAVGGGEMGQVRVRLDNAELARLTKEPWKVDLPTDKLTPGYHFLEVWASEKKGKWASATQSFLVVPASEPSIQVALSPEAAAEVEIAEPAPGDQPTGPAATLRSRNEAVEKALREGKSVTISEPTVFWVDTPQGKRFFYTLEREGVITYRSPALPVNTQILIQPKQADGPGLDPGTVLMKVRAGDLAGSFGPAAQVTLGIQAAPK